MPSTQWRVLYREFLFRVVDRELLSTYAQGDMSKLLLRFVSLLIFIGIVFAAPAALLPAAMPPKDVQALAWRTIGALSATTMLSVGLFAVLSWNTMFPDRIDALVLTPLPVRPRTVFFAKMAAVASGLGVAVLSLHLAPSLLWPLRLQGVMPDHAFGAFGVIWLIVAYWMAMMAAGLFIACLVIGLQGFAATLLPRPMFLRVSSYLQLTTFVVLMATYFLLPSRSTPAFWFLALYQHLIGVPQMAAIARQAWWSLGVSVAWAIAAYSLSYARTVRKIAEQADITPRPRVAWRWPRLGTGPQTAIVHFGVRTLIRSTQHRVILAFYWGIGFALTTTFVMLRGVKYPAFSLASLWESRSVPLIVSSLLMLMTSVLGARVVFSLPRELKANWIFRLTPLPGGATYLGARRRALFALSVAPVLILSAAILLPGWPLRPAVGHLVVLWLLGSTLVEIYLYGTRKIPFTCSYLPGKSTFQLMFWVSVLFLFLLTAVFSFFERRALDSAALYVPLVSVLATAWLLARVVTMAQGRSPDAQPQFEEEPTDRIVSLDVWDHRFAPASPRPPHATER